MRGAQHRYPPSASAPTTRFCSPFTTAPAVHFLSLCPLPALRPQPDAQLYSARLFVFFSSMFTLNVFLLLLDGGTLNRLWPCSTFDAGVADRFLEGPTALGALASAALAFQPNGSVRYTAATLTWRLSAKRGSNEARAGGRCQSVPLGGALCACVRSTHPAEVRAAAAAASIGAGCAGGCVLPRRCPRGLLPSPARSRGK